MAKIRIEIDGKNFQLFIDDKPVDDIVDIGMSGHKWEDYDGVDGSDVYFNYSVKNEQENDFRSVTRFCYSPATASFDSGKAEINKNRS